MITASALKLYCGYPRALAKLEPKTAKEREAAARKQAAADKGTMFHQAIEAWAKPGCLIPEVADDEVRGWIEMLAMTWTPRAYQLFEVAMGLRHDMTGVWCGEPSPHVYVARDDSPLLTAGRADAMWSTLIDGKLIVVVRDWKTGKWPVAEVGANPQLTALALAACSLIEADGFVREVYYVRDGYCDRDVDPILVGTPNYALCEAMVKSAALLDDTPRPGPHCESCWERRMKRCDAFQPTDAQVLHDANVTTT